MLPFSTYNTVPTKSTTTHSCLPRKPLLPTPPFLPCTPQKVKSSKPYTSASSTTSSSLLSRGGGKRKLGNIPSDSAASQDTDTLINTEFSNADVEELQQRNDSMDLDLDDDQDGQSRNMQPISFTESLKTEFESALDTASQHTRDRKGAGTMANHHEILRDDECEETVFDETESRVQSVEKRKTVTAATPQDSQQVSHLSSNAVLTVCCAMYRLWIRKPKTESPNAPALDFPFAATPAAYTKVCLDAGYKHNYPIGTKDWFPLFVFIMNNVFKRSRVSLPVVMVALLYVGRLRNLISLTSTINSTSPEIQLSQIFITSIIISQKVHSDVRHSNAEWARISHFTTDFLNEMERYWIFSYLHLDATFSVTPNQYKQWHAICQSLQVEYEFVFKSRSVPDQYLAVYLKRARRARPELVDEILRDRGFMGGMEELESLADSFVAENGCGNFAGSRKVDQREA